MNVIPDLPDLPDVPIPIPDLPSLLPVPLPGLEGPLFTVILGVAAIGFFVEGLSMFFEVARPENRKEYLRYTLLAAFPIGMLAMDYAIGDYLGVLFWGGMLVFDAFRLRLNLSRREAVTNIILWLRRNVIGDLDKR